MPPTTDTPRVRRWLRGRLNTLGLPVYRPQAPEDAVFPCVVFRRQGGTDIVDLSPGGIAAVRSVWLVFVAGRAEWRPESEAGRDALVAHADALHAALQTNQITAQSGRLIHSCQREYEYDDPVVENGIEYERMGGVYVVYSTLS